MSEKWAKVLNRRGLFNFAWQEATALAGSIVRPRQNSTLLRPPGALPEPAFLVACTRCGLCVTICPAKILNTAPALSGIAFGTPVVNLTKSYCRRCGECTRTCSSGALSIAAEKGLGVAQIKADSCLLHQGNLCGFCQFNCPEKAVVLKDRELHVIAEKCKGCGKCNYLCPAEKAISIIAKLQ